MGSTVNTPRRRVRRSGAALVAVAFAAGCGTTLQQLTDLASRVREAVPEPPADLVARLTRQDGCWAGRYEGVDDTGGVVHLVLAEDGGIVAGSLAWAPAADAPPATSLLESGRAEGDALRGRWRTAGSVESGGFELGWLPEARCRSLVGTREGAAAIPPLRRSDAPGEGRSESAVSDRGAGLPPAGPWPAPPLRPERAEGAGAFVLSAEKGATVFAVGVEDGSAFDVRFAGPARFAPVVGLPQAQGGIPGGEAPAPRPQVWDEGSRRWRAVDGVRALDPASGSVAFSVAPDEDVALRFRLEPYAPGDTERRFSSARFVIHFVPPSVGGSDAVLDDAEWAKRVGRPTGNAVLADVPDLIEDMAVALEQIYDSLLAVKGVGSATLFQALALPQHVFVRNTGEGAGASPLGGPMEISNTRLEARQNGAISAWEDLTHVVAHEMAHVFQGQYYLGGQAGNVWNALGPGNRWFVEASSNYLATLACRSDPVTKREFYTKDGYENYLHLSINGDDDLSYYAAGAFIEWLSGKYAATLLHEVWRGSDGLDLTNLDRAIRAHGEARGIEGAFREYMKWFLTHPEAIGGFNRDAKLNSLGRHASELLTAAGGEDNFSARTSHIQVRRTLPPLSAHYMQGYARVDGSALLVMDPGIGTTFTTDLGWLTYDAVGNKDADYAARTPLEDLVSLPGSRPYLVPGFGRQGSRTSFEQLVFNPSPAQARPLDVAYYLLRVPGGIQVVDGAVSWSLAELGNIPPERIRGYRVYADGRLLGEVGLVQGAARGSFAHPALKASSSVTVAVVDSHGTVWPEYAGLSPARPEILSGESVTLTATFSEPLDPAPVDDRWSVTGAGSVVRRDFAQAVYTAPAAPGTYTVEVVNANNPTQRATATIRVVADPGAAIVVGKPEVDIDIDGYQDPKRRGTRDQIYGNAGCLGRGGKGLIWTGTEFSEEVSCIDDVGWLQSVRIRGKISADGKVLERLSVHQELHIVPVDSAVSWDQVYFVEVVDIPLDRVDRIGRVTYAIQGPTREVSRKVRSWYRHLTHLSFPGVPVDQSPDPVTTIPGEQTTIRVTFRPLEQPPPE